MSLSLATLALTLPLAPSPDAGTLLAAVPEDAYALVHGRDIGALRARIAGNDWCRLLGSELGSPMLGELNREIRRATHSDPDELWAVASRLEGEVVLFDTGSVAGFLCDPPTDRAALVAGMRAWVPAGENIASRTLEIAGGRVELVAWPGNIDGWSGRDGHFAAFVEHADALAIYSGDDSKSVLAAVTTGLTRLGTEQRAPIVSSYLEAGGGAGGGVEVFVDFTPLVGPAEAALKRTVEDVLPDPTGLLGLEQGTWMHVAADVFVGQRIDCRARLRLPPETLSAELADTFRPLPATLPADLPAGVWGLYAVNWDIGSFYRRARAALEDVGPEEGLAKVDAGLEAAKGLTGVDPVVDVVNQLAGDIAWFFVEPEGEGIEELAPDEQLFRSLGFQAGLVDGDAFLLALETLMEVGRMEDVLEWEEIAGADAYLMSEDTFDGGLAVLPRMLDVALSRSVLERSLEALARVEGASLAHGSRMRATIDENRGACFLACVEMRPLRAFALPDSRDDALLPPLADGEPARDPFEAQLVATARRTADGFELRLHTR